MFTIAAQRRAFSSFVLLAATVSCSSNGGTTGEDTSSAVQAITGTGGTVGTGGSGSGASGGVSTVGLQLQVLTNSCTASQAQQFFKVVNAGTTPVKASDIKIKFWVDDTSASSVVASVSTGGCLTQAGSCSHNVSGVTAAVTPFSPACGSDSEHQANREITVSNTDNTMLAAGQSWNNVQVALHLASYGNFNPGASKWFSPCLAGTSYQADNHFAVYYQNQLVFSSGISSPDCRAPHGWQPLSGHISNAMAVAPLVGRVPSSTLILLSVGLPVRDAQGLANKIRDVSNPNSPNYRHYLKPEEFAATYSPLDTDYQALATWAQAKGLSVVNNFTNRITMTLRGTAAAVEQALYVNLNYYLRPDGSQFYALDREPSIDLTASVLHISGLDNFILPTLDVSGGSGPNGELQGYDFRNAYASCTSLTGSTQCIGLLAIDGYDPSDITTYVSNNGLPSNITVTPVLLDGVSGIPSRGRASSEITVDIEMALSMAPGAEIVVFEGPGTGTTRNDVLSAMATRQPLCAQLSSSIRSGTTAVEQQLINQLAVQGQSFFQSSGDQGEYPTDPGDSLDYANTTIVGASHLYMNSSPATKYDHETGTSGSGHGILSNVALPDYQSQLGGINNTSTTNRNSPDVTIAGIDIRTTINGAFDTNWGTSYSAPLWAGFMALINDQGQSNGVGPVGFANPLLYALSRADTTGNYFNDFYATGYDPYAGLGSPKCALIDQLSSSSPLSNLDIAVGSYFGCAVRSNGTVSCWGQNDSGQMGNSISSNPQLTPLPVDGLTGIDSIAAGAAHACALQSDFAVRCWGNNSNGQLGNGTTNTPNPSAAIATLFPNAVQVTAGHAHTCVRMANSGVQCAGRNEHGQLGNGTKTDSATPVDVVVPSTWNGWVSLVVAGGSQTCAVVGDDNHVECWGQIVPHSLVDQVTPTALRLPPDGHDNTLIGVGSLAVGYHHNCALTNAGLVECWGAGSSGELGNINDPDRYARDWPEPNFPVLSCSDSQLLDNVFGVAVGGDANGFSCAQKFNNGVAEVWCWGDNSFGQLGDGTNLSRACAAPVQSLEYVTRRIHVGSASACSLADQGVSCWGWNNLGQLGNGTTVDRSVPGTVHFF